MDRFLADGILCTLGIILNLVMLKSFRLSKRTYDEDRILRAFVQCDLSICVSEVFMCMLTYLPSHKNYWLIVIVWTFNYTILAVCAYLWFLYCVLRVVPKKKINFFRLKLLFIPIIVVFLLTASSPLTDWVITVDSQGYYRRGPLYVIPWIIDPLYIIAGTVLTKICASNKLRYRFFPSTIMLFMVAVGCIFQNLSAGMVTIGVSIAVALVKFNLSLKDEQAYIDPLTGVYNRQFMGDYIVDNTDKMIGIEFDLDDFKKINDTFGHLVGDNALSTFGQILREAAGDQDYPIRTGGDEFVMLCYTSDMKRVEAMVEEIRKKTESINEKHKDGYQLTFSAGIATAIPGGKNDIDTLLHRMDEAMYKIKTEHHLNK